MKQLLGVLTAINAGAMAIVAPPAHAGCADWSQLQQPVMQSPGRQLPARDGFIRTAYLQVDDRAGQLGQGRHEMAAIVGLWKFTFVAAGNPAGPPDGTILDTGYAEWHSDGTEIANSGSRPPPSQSFCMGVWKQVGPSTFKLNHFALSWSPDGSTFVGPGNIREEVTVDRSGNRFFGTFSVVQYDATELSVLAHVVGTVTGTRVTAD